MKTGMLETITNQYPDREYKVQITIPEFTCLCPEKRDQPDFATIVITYIPGDHLIELKSLKYYVVEYRNEEIYHEAATNKFLEDLVKALKPRYMRVLGDWNVRGGIKTIVEVEYVSEEWEGNPEEVVITQKTRTASQGENR